MVHPIGPRQFLCPFALFSINAIFIIGTKEIQVKSLSNPTKLKPLMKDDGIIQVIIETPADSRNKFAFDPAQGIFALKKVLSAGMVFPYDFGFLPQTIAPDGDPIDVLLLWMNQPSPVVPFVPG
jgi:hypothetical protein